jgi:hypothetical protein
MPRISARDILNARKSMVNMSMEQMEQRAREHAYRFGAPAAEPGNAKRDPFPEGVTNGPPPPKILPPKSKTIDPQTPLRKDKKKPVVENAEAKPVLKGKKGVTTAGVSQSEAFTDSLENGRPVDTMIQLNNAGQKEKIAKQLAKPTTGDTSTQREGEDKTIEGMTTNDPKAITMKAPFSFAALRLRIGA